VDKYNKACIALERKTNPSEYFKKGGLKNDTNEVGLS